MSPEFSYNFIDPDLVENYQENWPILFGKFNNLYAKFRSYAGDIAFLSSDNDIFQGILDISYEGLVDTSLLPVTYLDDKENGTVNLRTVYELFYAVMVDVVGVDNVEQFMDETKDMVLTPDSSTPEYREKVIQIYKDLKDLGFTDIAMCR